MELNGGPGFIAAVEPRNNGPGLMLMAGFEPRNNSPGLLISIQL